MYNRLVALEIPDIPLVWTSYVCLLVTCASLTFGGVSELVFDTHDQEYMLDFSQGGVTSLLSPEKRMPGRPIFELLLWTEYRIWGENAQAFHIAGIVLHIISSCLLALVCRQLGSDMVTGLTAGLLFLLGVSHFRAVHWISAHCYPLAFIFCSLAVLFFSRWYREDKVVYIVATYIFALSGILAHISASLALPICLIAVRREHWKRTILALSPIAVATVVCILFVRFYYDSAPQAASLNTGFDFIESVKAYVLMVGQLVTTTHWLLIAPYKTPIWQFYAGALAVLVACWAIIYKKGQTAIWCSWFLLGLVPFLLTDPDHIQEMEAERSRYLYLSSAAAAVLLSMGLSYFANFLARYSTPLAVSSYTVLVLSLCTSGGFFLKRSEAVSAYTSARYYASAEKRETAIAQYQRALAQGQEVLPLRDTYYRLCNLLIAAGGDFVPVLNEARSTLPNDDSIMALFHVIESLSLDSQVRETSMQKLDEMASILEQNDPAEHDVFRSMVATIYHNLGLGLASHSVDDRALASLKLALNWEPDRYNTLYKMYKTHLRQGRLKEAVTPLERIVRLDSTKYGIFYILGQIYTLQHEDSKADQAFQRVLRLAPESTEADKVRKIINR